MSTTQELRRRPASVTTEQSSRPSRLRVIIGEVVLLAVAAVLYSLVRGLTNDRVDVAFGNAEQVISFERSLGIFVEPDLQQWATSSDLVVNLANAVYISYWPIVGGTLLWLLLRHPASYPLYRNALLTSGAITLLVFAAYPLAPPRFLPEYGFIDTIAKHSDGYRDFNASAFVNEYAAMPSLHFGWVLLATIAVVRVSSHPAVRAGAMALPVLMLASIVLTGNHYIVDAVVGGAVVLAGLLIATRLDKGAWPPPIRMAMTAARTGTGSGRRGASGPGPWRASRPSARPPARE